MYRVLAITTENYFQKKMHYRPLHLPKKYYIIYTMLTLKQRGHILDSGANPDSSTKSALLQLSLERI